MKLEFVIDLTDTTPKFEDGGHAMIVEPDLSALDNEFFIRLQSWSDETSQRNRHILLHKLVGRKFKVTFEEIADMPKAQKVVGLSLGNILYNEFVRLADEAEAEAEGTASGLPPWAELEEVERTVWAKLALTIDFEQSDENLERYGRAK